MWFNVAVDGFKVVDVTPTGPAEGAGFKVGDHIIAIDGKGAKAVAVYDLRWRLRNSSPGTVVTFKVLRDGQARDLKLTLRDLI
jgi:S1-C subfamily serine protease